MTRCAIMSAISVLTLIGCGQPDNQVAPAEPTEKPVEAVGPQAAPTDGQPPVVKLANPASTHCIDKGGELEIMTAPGGQFGVCIFDDGSRCEEWAFFRGECKPGDCTNPTGKCD